MALERRPPLAGLEGRTAAPWSQWRQGPAALAVGGRARADASALAGRVAAPAALQVGDRVHLVGHVSDALNTRRQAPRWRQPALTGQPAASPPRRRDQRHVLRPSAAKRA